MSKVGRLRFELRTNRLKAECSTAELATLLAYGTTFRPKVCRQAPLKRITQAIPLPRGSRPNPFLSRLEMPLKCLSDWLLPACCLEFSSCERPIWVVDQPRTVSD